MRALKADVDPPALPPPATYLVGFQEYPGKFAVRGKWSNQVLRKVLEQWIANREPEPCTGPETAIMEADADTDADNADDGLDGAGPYILVCGESCPLPAQPDLGVTYAKFQKAKAVWCADLTQCLHLHRALGVPYGNLCVVPWLFMCHVA